MKYRLLLRTLDINRYGNRPYWDPSTSRFLLNPVDTVLVRDAHESVEYSRTASALASAPIVEVAATVGAVSNEKAGTTLTISFELPNLVPMDREGATQSG